MKQEEEEEEEVEKGGGASEESDDEYHALSRNAGNGGNLKSGGGGGAAVHGHGVDKYSEYLQVLKKHKECLDAPCSAILWIVDNGTVSRSKYQIPKTHHNPPRSDRERGGYAEILRSLGWKSNYANDGHYDWWMKPDEFDIVSFREAVNSLRTIPPSLHHHSHDAGSSHSPSAAAAAAGGGGGAGHAATGGSQLHGHHGHAHGHAHATAHSHAHALTHGHLHPAHGQGQGHGTGHGGHNHSPHGHPTSSNHSHQRGGEPSDARAARHTKRSRSPPPVETRGKRHTRRPSKDEDMDDNNNNGSTVGASGKPFTKRYRTLISEYVGSDEKIEDLEARYLSKKQELEEINTELDRVRRTLKELAAKENDLAERRDKCGDHMRKLRMGLRIYKVRETLLKMGDEGDETRRDILEAEKKLFLQDLANDRKILKSLLIEQRKRVESSGDVGAMVAFEGGAARIEETVLSTADTAPTADVANVLMWMNARLELAEQNQLHRLYYSFVDDVLHQRRDMSVSLTASTKRADDALRKVMDLEKRVATVVSSPELDEEALKAAIKARDHQREECIAHISFLLAGPLREALEDTSPAKHADFLKLHTYYITKLHSSQALYFEANTLQVLYDYSSNDDAYYVRERLQKYQHNFPEVAHYLQLAAVGNLPRSAIHLRRVGTAGHVVVVGTKGFFLKELKDPSTVPTWPPGWLVDIEHISYILPIIGIIEYEGRTYTQMPLQACNLRTWLADPANRTAKNVQRIFAQLLFTVDWLGEYGKFLGHLKPENVFIESGNAVVDISSIFGTFNHRNDYAPPLAGAIPYATHAYDMWSLAMMLYEACFNRPPPPHAAPFQREGVLSLPLALALGEADSKFSEALAELLVAVTSGFNDGEHLTSHEALAHTFFAPPSPPSALSEARARLSQLSIARTRTDHVGKVARAHVVPSITSAFADVEKRKRAALHRWEVYSPSPISAPTQPFTRELLALYFRDVFDHGQLFISSDTGRYLPNHTCSDSTPFVVLGYLTAKAALTGTPIQCQLAHSVFRFILMELKEALYTDLTEALADLYTFDTALARQFKFNCILPLQHTFTDDAGHLVNDDNKERHYLNEINRRLMVEPRKQLEWIKLGFKEVAPVWDVVASLDPTSLARVICGRQWVDEGFLKQQLVFDPRVFFPPSHLPSPSSSCFLPASHSPPPTGGTSATPTMMSISTSGPFSGVSISSSSPLPLVTLMVPPEPPDTLQALTPPPLEDDPLAMDHHHHHHHHHHHQHPPPLDFECMLDTIQEEDSTALMIDIAGTTTIATPSAAAIAHAASMRAFRGSGGGGTVGVPAFATATATATATTIIPATATATADNSTDIHHTGSGVLSNHNVSVSTSASSSNQGSPSCAEVQSAFAVAPGAHLPSATTATYLRRVLDEWADMRDRDRLSRFMYLCTNCVYIPWGGLGDGVFVVRSVDGAPHPHGCCNMLHLPETNSYVAFRDMLEDMVRSIDAWIYQLV